MELVKLIEEHSYFAFSGKIKILQASNNQYLGHIFQKDGTLIHAQLRELSGKKALFRIVMDELDGQVRYKYVPEPDILTSTDKQTFSYSYTEFVETMNKFLSQYYLAKKFAPPPNLQLVVNSAYLYSKGKLSEEEFDILYHLSGPCSVADIYSRSSLCDFEIVIALVSLRNKGAIKVLKG